LSSSWSRPGARSARHQQDGESKNSGQLNAMPKSQGTKFTVPLAEFDLTQQRPVKLRSKKKRGSDTLKYIKLIHAY
jgi:hypothetical protein